MNKLNVLDWIAVILTIIGAINWGLVGVADWNLVDSIFGMGMAATIVYDLVGLAGIYLLLMVGKLAKK